jgi:iron complex outermembrane receptor protein
VQSGRERHKGVEFGTSGKLTKDLTLFGGATFFGAKVLKNANSPSMNGKTPANVPEQAFKLYAEYAVPRVHGFTAIAGINATGKFFADNLNADRLPSIATEDVGLRYEVKWEKPLIFRINVTNLTNRSYWMQGGYIGAPRAILFSGQIKL